MQRSKKKQRTKTNIFFKNKNCYTSAYVTEYETDSVHERKQIYRAAAILKSFLHYLYLICGCDGNSEHDAHPWRKKSFLSEKKNQFMTTLDLIEGLYQIKWQRLLLSFAPFLNQDGRNASSSNLVEIYNIKPFFWVSI